MDYAKATQELDDEQDRIYYGIDIHGSTILLGLVIYSIKEVDEEVSDKEMS